MERHGRPTGLRPLLRPAGVARILLVGACDIERVLLRRGGVEVVEVAVGEGLLDAIDRAAPALVVVAIGADGEERSVSAVSARHPALPILVVAEQVAERRVVAALKAGASAYLTRGELRARLVPAVRELLAGGAPMSPAAARVVLERARRESNHLLRAVSSVPVTTAGVGSVALGDRKRAVLEMLSRGLSYQQIGVALGISVNTVRSHVRDLYERLGACTGSRPSCSPSNRRSSLRPDADGETTRTAWSCDVEEQGDRLG